MSWNYRLIYEKGKTIPRIGEVYADEEGRPDMYSIHKYWETAWWYLTRPLEAFFKKPVRESDFTFDTEKKANDLKYSTLIPIEKDGEEYFITLPEELIPDNWEVEDKIRWDETEMCTDDGEYPSYTLINESLEERMKGE